MDIIENKRISASECLNHWYYQSKFELLKRVLRREQKGGSELRLADVGCGMGVFLALLEKSGLIKSQNLSGVDPGHLSQVFAVNTQVPIYPEFPKDESYEVLLLMDVLEHVERPEELLREAISRCRSGGLIFITVPAHQWLWSAHDVFLKHYRRYNLKMLQDLAAECPLVKIEYLHYFYALILPVVAGLRLFRGKQKAISSDLKPVAGWVNKLLQGLLKVELGWARWNKVAGVTAVATLRRL